MSSRVEHILQNWRKRSDLLFIGSLMNESKNGPLSDVELSSLRKHMPPEMIDQVRRYLGVFRPCEHDSRAKLIWKCMTCSKDAETNKGGFAVRRHGVSTVFCSSECLRPEKLSGLSAASEPALRTGKRCASCGKDISCSDIEYEIALTGLWFQVCNVECLTQIATGLHLHHIMWLSDSTSGDPIQVHGCFNEMELEHLSQAVSLLTQSKADLIEAGETLLKSYVSSDIKQKDGINGVFSYVTSPLLERALIGDFSDGCEHWDHFEKDRTWAIRAKGYIFRMIEFISEENTPSMKCRTHPALMLPVACSDSSDIYTVTLFDCPENDCEDRLVYLNRCSRKKCGAAIDSRDPSVEWDEDTHSYKCTNGHVYNKF